MTTIDLRNFLLHWMSGGRANAVPLNREILDQVFAFYRVCEAVEKKAIVYQIDETVIFLSESGLTKPRQILFVDSVSGESFLQEIE
ncbi:MAG: hypothetical protein HY584_03535 [Candidatus Omnitrophica bacterium]|nr:hypothetical protein [Candidatus Omnitrophota bacterium]